MVKNHFVLLVTATFFHGAFASQGGAEAAADYDKADALLNHTYKQLIAVTQANDWQTRETRLAQLKKAEQAWVNYRDLHCTYDMWFNAGGTVMGERETVCKTELTQQREKVLRALFEEVREYPKYVPFTEIRFSAGHHVIYSGTVKKKYEICPRPDKFAPHGDILMMVDGESYIWKNWQSCDLPSGKDIELNLDSETTLGFREY